MDNEDADQAIDPDKVMAALENMSKTVTLMNKVIDRLRSHVEESTAYQEAESARERAQMEQRVLH